VSNDSEEVLRTSDPHHAEMVLALLQQEGIHASLRGTRQAALIGVAPHIVPLRLVVPREQADEARALIASAEALDEGTLTAAALAGTAPESDEGRERDDPPGAEPRRKLLMAAGATFCVPGGAHFYGRSPWTGLVFGLGWLVVLVAAVGLPPVALSLPLLLLADLVFGLRATARYARGQRPSRARQIGRGLLLVVPALAIGLLAGTSNELQRAYQRWQLERRFELTCSQHRLTVTNRGAGAVTLIPLTVRQRVWHESIRHRGIDVLSDGPESAELAPGESVALALRRPSAQPARSVVPHLELLFGRRPAEGPVPEPDTGEMVFRFRWLRRGSGSEFSQDELVCPLARGPS